MKRRTGAAALLGALALVGACDRAAKTPAPAEPSMVAAFSHDLPQDVSGDYLPLKEVRVDNWRLRRVLIGRAADFIAWEAGERSPGFGPVMIEFEDMVGPPLETGQGPKRRRLRLIPASYAVAEDRVRIEALSGGLGAVSFEGALDQDALAAARRDPGDENEVLNGTLKVGSRTFDGVSMRWRAGDRAPAAEPSS